MLSILLFSIVFSQDTIPYKSSDQFEVRLDYQFKMRPAPSQTEFNFNETTEEHKRRVGTTPLPYLILELEILEASPAEDRVRGFSSSNQFLNKRGVKAGTTLKIDMGFTNDMKDRVTPHEYILIFSDKSRKENSKIVIFIEENGSFLVNGEKRGQF